MAITRLNSLAIPAGTVEPADISYPLTNFSSTGIDDNATSTAITIDSSENVGIGTTSPDTPLEVSVAGSGATDVLKLTTTATNSIPAILFEGDGFGTQHNIARIRAQVDDASNGGLIFETENSGTVAERMRIDSSGRVGIGVTSMVNPLQVGVTPNTASKTSGSAFDGGALRLDGNLGSADSEVAILGGANDGLSSGIGFARQNGSDWGTQIRFYTHGSAITTTDELTERMRLDSSGDVLIGATSSYLSAANRTVVHTEGGTDGALLALKTSTGDFYIVSGASGSTNTSLVTRSNGYMNFYTNNTERMRIDSSGNVGIGTTSPARNLTIGGASASTSSLQLTNATSGTASTDGFQILQYTSGAVQLWNYENNYTAFGTNNAERMRIDYLGNVGIGTTSPNAPLTIGGAASNAGNAAVSIYRSGNGYGNVRSSSNYGVSFLLAGASDNADELRLTQDNTKNGYLYNEANAPLVFGTNNTERMRIDGSGNLLVGTTSTMAGGGDGTNGFGVQGTGGGKYVVSQNQTDVNLYIAKNSGYSNSTFTSFWVAASNVGSITTTGSATAYNTSSDQRLKENIVDAPAGNIDAIRVRSFDWKADGAHQTYGMVAQELVDVAPEAVSQGETEDDMWGVDYSKLVPMMIKEIQDLKAEVAAQRAELSALQGA